MKDRLYPGLLVSNNIWAASIVLVLCALAVPLVNHSLIDHPPQYDELLHVLAARGIAETGQPVIEDGVYTRAEIYTRLIEKTSALHSDELIAARLPALLFTVLLAALISYWISRNVGWLAGLSSGLILVITPPTINLAVLVRFYTLHALVVTLLIILLYEASRRLKNGWFCSAVAVICLVLMWLAMQLHEISKITFGATAAGLVFLLVFRWRNVWGRPLLRNPILSALAALIVLVLGLTGLWMTGIIEMLRQTTPVWSETRANQYGFYLTSLGTQLPFIWPLFPVFAVLAVFSNKRLGGYLLTIVFVAFLANSIASQKATRYVFHFYPLVCMLWGIGFQHLLSITCNFLSERYRWSQLSSASLVLTLSLACVVSTLEIRRTVKLILGRPLVNDVVSLNDESDWSTLQSIIEPQLSNVDRVIASSGFKSLHALGRYAYELHATVVAETDTGEEFGIDPRTGRGVISSAESVGKVIDMDGIEMIIVDEIMLNTPYGVNSNAVQLIDERCTSIDVPDAARVVAWRCDS